MNRKQHIKLQDVSSENLKKVGYDDYTRTLVILFHNSKKYYFYKNVPKKVFMGLLSAESVGQYFHSKVRHRYNYIAQ